MGFAVIDDRKTGSASGREIMTFVIGPQEFCIDVMSVREIRVWTQTTPMARAPAYVRGVINLRGSVLPIVDFAARLGYPPAEPTNRHAILVVEAGAQAIGLLVEGVSEILTISNDMIQPTPDVASQSAKDLVTGIIAIDGRMIGLISLDSVVPRASEQAA